MEQGRKVVQFRRMQGILHQIPEHFVLYFINFHTLLFRDEIFKLNKGKNEAIDLTVAIGLCIFHLFIIL